MKKKTFKCMSEVVAFLITSDARRTLAQKGIVLYFDNILKKYVVDQLEKGGT